MHVVKDDFPIDYEGYVRNRYVRKSIPNTRDRFPDKTTGKMRSRKKAEKVRISNVTFKLHPFKKVTLTRSETIVQAVTNNNRIGIVSSAETKPGIFIGNCLVEPEEYTCPISIINTTEESVEITTPLVTIDEIRVSDRAKRELRIHTGTKRKPTQPATPRTFK